MYAVVRGLIAVFVVWVLVTQVRHWYRWRALRKWGEERGCGEARTVKNKLPGGIERYALLLKDMKNIDFLEIIRARSLEMGTTYRAHNLFNRSSIMTSDPLNIQAVLATQFTDFGLGPARRENFHALLGNGIFTSEGEEWAHYRQQLKPQFTRDQFSGLVSAAQHLEVLFRALPQEDEGGWIREVDIMPFVYRFTMDVATEFLFGKSVNSQSTTIHALESGGERMSARQIADEKFADAMNYAQEFISYRMRLGPLGSLVPSKKFRDAGATVKEFADEFVQAALARNPASEKKSVEREYGRGKGKFVLLDALLEETRNRSELRDQVLQTLLAGRDTTAAFISWELLLLAREPDQYAALRNIVIDQFGTLDNPKEDITFSSLKSCKALTHIQYETLRLYPLVPLNSRTALKKTTLPTGGGSDGKMPIAVMEGEQVAYSSYVMHRSKEIWGEDAEVWRPSRWEGRKLGWEWIAFSGGPRVCLGQQYALNEANFVLVKILQKFDKIEALDMGPIKKGLAITLSPANGVRIRMHRASE